MIVKDQTVIVYGSNSNVSFDRRFYFICITFPIIMSFLLAAHFMRWMQPGLVFISLTSPILLVPRRLWTIKIYQFLLTAGSIRWLYVALFTVMRRISAGEPWGRATIIIGTTAVLTLLSAFLLELSPVRKRHNHMVETTTASTASFIAVVIVLSFIHLKLKDLIPLIAERLLPGSGWIEIFILGVYAAWLSDRIITTGRTAELRKKVWTAFSAVFFIQLIMGISGFNVFLLTGKLHLPIPGMIVAGPLFRGELSFFMPLLLVSTLIIAGPAWCSWLCYFGCWDLIAATTRKHAGTIPKKNNIIRILILFILAGGALLLRLLNTPKTLAITAGLLF